MLSEQLNWQAKPGLAFPMLSLTNLLNQLLLLYSSLVLGGFDIRDPGHGLSQYAHAWFSFIVCLRAVVWCNSSHACMPTLLKLGQS